MKSSKASGLSYASKVESKIPVLNNKGAEVAVDDRSKNPKGLGHKSRNETPIKGKEQRSPESLEKLIQEGDGETSVTVDEFQFSNVQANANVPFVPQPMFDESVPPPPLGMLRPPRPCPPALPPGAGAYNRIPPPVLHCPGSPPLPLAGPLQLVYLQQTPGGVNIIPFQAVGFPSYTPCSPLGFPAHPHHPVVVQSPQDCPSAGTFQNIFIPKD